MLVIVLCSLLWEATTEASASHSCQLGCSGAECSGSRGREEAATLQQTTVYPTDLGCPCVSLSIHNKLGPHVDTIVSGRRGFAGRCQVCCVCGSNNPTLETDFMYANPQCSNGTLRWTS